ncbi:hypothetical protein HPB47_010971 [Ixodes persulcatus]|uniref:Uncharacterized protein n=1 Tax=Ixodes persulcatus TaxID=34615 RepID=A0AC60NXV2_IXOPE|nr:hypothetical protein HPB47_010971 [Ixodes persulcatus]
MSDRSPEVRRTGMSPYKPSPTCPTYISVVIDFAEDRGIAKWNAISIISSFTVTDLLARLCSGWITDRKHVSRSTWVSFNFGLWALTLVLMPACSSHPGQMVFAAVYGWTTGCVLTLVPVLYAEVANLDQFAVCFGTGSCIVGAITMVKPVIIARLLETGRGSGRHCKDRDQPRVAAMKTLITSAIALSLVLVCCQAHVVINGGRVGGGSYGCNCATLNLVAAREIHSINACEYISNVPS